MKTNLFNLLILTYVFFSCSPEEKKSDRQSRDLKENVKSVFTLSYNAIDKFGEGDIVKGNIETANYQEFDSTGNMTLERDYFTYAVEHKYHYEYNEKGEKALWISYENGVEKYKDSYKYDSLGNLVLEMDHIKNKEDVIRYEFDANKRIIIKYEKYDTYKYKYDDRGNMIEEKDISKLGIDPVTNSYEYDKDNNLVKIVRWYTPSNKKYESCTLYKYDDKKRMTDRVSFNTLIPNESAIDNKIRRSYIDDVAMVPSHIIEWDKNGEIKTENYYYYQLLEGKPVTTIICDKDLKITNLYCNTNKRNGLGYYSDMFSLKSDFYNVGEYKYINGILKNIIHQDGNTTQFTYDDDKIIESTRSIGDSRIVTRFDKKGRPILITNYDAKNKITQNTEKSYSGNTKNSTISSKSLNTKTKEEITVEEIYKDGRLSELHTTSGGTTENIIYTYDENGLLISMNNTSKGETYTYTYIIDAFGNWNQRTCILNGKPKSIDERIIQYYLTKAV